MERGIGPMKVQVKVSQDALEAHMIVSAEPTEEISKEDLLSQLKSHGVVYGIMEDAIENIVKSKIFDKPVLVAVGKKPVDGKDGQVVIIRPEQTEGGQSVADKGKIDLRELPARMRTIVRTGQIVAEIIPPTEGEEGRNVLGRVLKPKPGKPPQLKLGRNVRLIEDGRKIVAAVDGILIAAADGTIDVNEVLNVQGDVDYSTGNIDFPGEVHIKGDVKPGFTVKAKGDVAVGGVIEAATVVSFEGSVSALGIKGREKGIVKAKEEVRAKFVENAIVEAGKAVIIDGPITNSQIKAGEKVIAKGNKGVIVGGTISAGSYVEAEEIGSELGVGTHIEVGMEPEERERMKVLKAQLELDRENLNKLVAVYKTLKEIMDRNQGKLPPDKVELFRKVGQSMINLRNNIEVAERELEEIQKRIREKYTFAKVIARRVLHPGVEISIFDKRYYNDKALQKVLVVIENEQVRIGGYSGGSEA